MSEWIRTRLKWLIAGDEMAEVERWRVRCSEYDRWLAAYPDIALVLQNLRGVAQGRLESMGIELDVPWPTDAPGPWGINALRVKVARMRDGIGESRREPLPADEIHKLCGVEDRDAMMKAMALYCARAIEAAHGIKEQA